MTLYLYNSLTRKKEEFKPLDEKNVRMYVCGPTVYDQPHLGNARAVVVYDVLYRLLKHLYPKVTYVRNITDVDDKIIKAAKENSESIAALTKRITDGFHADMRALGCLDPDEEPKATGHISEVVQMIEQLIENEHAYVAEGHVLFSVKSAKDYGKLSGKKLEDLVAGARVEVEGYKKDPGDFVLWKPADKDDDPSCVFDSPWGKGRPGWHIECSAMSTKYLGETFDIHGGGADLKFPHHENEIAQSLGANPKSEFARYWVHNGFLTVNGEKMAKSEGNFITVRELLDKAKNEFERRKLGEIIRFALIKTKYNEPLDWTEERVETSKNDLNRFYRALKVSYDRLDIENIEEWLKQEKLSTPIPHDSPKKIENFNSHKIAFDEAISDDLNTPRALTALFHMASELLAGAINDYVQHEWLLSYSERLEIIGFGKDKENVQSWFKGDVDSNQIETKIAARDAAKKEKNFAEADRIRAELKDQGIILEDSPTGTTWRKA